MSALRKLYKGLTSLHWEIGFLDNTFEGIVRDDELKLTPVTHNFPNSWFTNPFILDVTDDTIVVLVEEVIKGISKGRISKLMIDRRSNYVIEKKVILERPGHLSFPIIYHKDDKICVYPEDNKDDVLNIYECSPINDDVALIHELSDKPLTDAVFTDLFGKPQLFMTRAGCASGFQLDQYEWSDTKQQFIYATSSVFPERIARIAGYFFKINEKVYRPAQESNINCGHAISLQETSFVDGKWVFREVRKMISPYFELSQLFHTLNSYKGVVVVNVLGKRYPLASKMVNVVAVLAKRTLKN